MINSDDIEICRENCDDMKNSNTLIGEIQSIRQESSTQNLLIEFSIGGISFNSKITREEMQSQTLLPGDKIHVNINVDEVCWI